MASRKKQSEGIALLSMYYDEEEDEEMEDAKNEDEEPMRTLEDAPMADSDRVSGDHSGDELITPRDEGETSAATPRSSQATIASESSRTRRGGKLAIVDYGHDEVAMSPEPEEGEIGRSHRAMFGMNRQPSNGDFQDKTPSGTVQTPSNNATPQLSDPSQSDKVNDAVESSEIEDTADAIKVEEKDIDPLDKFLPPPPKDKCSEELQRKINKFLDYKKAGKSFNAEVRNRKDYRNPDFLLHAVSYQDIDQIGSCFDKNVFDPHGYDKSDYYDEIEADIRRDLERKEQERKKTQKVEFLSAGTQSGIIPTAAKVPGVLSGASALPTAETLPRDGRQNKKSKWDKIDGDRKNPLPPGVQDPTLVVGAQTTALSAVNTSSGYMAFVQQRKREVEEKRSSDKKLDRRS